jgi:uncharacterized lipoprotein YajG
MPYIKDELRKSLDDSIKSLANDIHVEAANTQICGLLNYTITKLILEIYSDRKLSYSDWNEIIGSLECCKLELYRRKIGPYEDIKIMENGDVR